MEDINSFDDLDSILFERARAYLIFGTPRAWSALLTAYAFDDTGKPSTLAWEVYTFRAGTLHLDGFSGDERDRMALRRDVCGYIRAKGAVRSQPRFPEGIAALLSLDRPPASSQLLLPRSTLSQAPTEMEAKE